MSKLIEPIIDLDYNVSAALMLIFKDSILKDIFTEKINIDYSILSVHAKEGTLNQKTKNTIRGIFDKIILTQETLSEEYQKIFNEIDTNVDTVEETVNKTKLPRRYGKVAILKDIELQGGKPNSVQLTALAVNDLKNLYVKLNTKLVNDLLTDNPSLTEEDYRNIRTTITLMQNKFKKFLQVPTSSNKK